MTDEQLVLAPVDFLVLGRVPVGPLRRQLVDRTSDGGWDTWWAEAHVNTFI